MLLSEMQIELHGPGVEKWEAAAAAKPRLKLMALYLQLSAALKLILRAAFHCFCSMKKTHYLLSDRDPPAGRDEPEGGWAGGQPAMS